MELAAATSETARVAQKLKVMYRINKSLGGGAAAEETAADHEDSKSRSESRKRKFSSSRHSARGPSKAEGNSSNSDTEGDVQNGDLSTNDETSPYKSRSSPQIDTSNPQAHTGTAGSTAPTKDDSTARYQYDARRDAEATDSVNAAMAESATFDAAVMLDTQDNLLAVGETQLLRQANQYGESLPPEIGNGTGLSTTSSVVDSTAMQLHHGPPPMTTTMTLTPDESDTAAGERNMNHAAEVPSPSGAVNSTSASDTSAVRLAISPCETATTATVPASKLRLSRQTPPPLESHAASNVPDSGSDSKNGGRSNANNNTKYTTHTSHAVPLNRFQRVVYRVKPAHLAATKSDSDGADFVDDSRSNSSSTLRSSSASGRSTNSNKCSTDEDIVGANSAESPLPRPSAAPSKKRQRRDKVPSGDALSDDGNGSSSKSSERGGARYFSRATDEKNTSDDVYHRFESSASPVKRADVNTSTRTTKMASSTGTEDANTEGQDRGRPIVVSKRAFVHDKDATAAAVPALPTARGIFVDDLDRGVHGDTATAAAAFASNDFDNPRASTDHDAGATIANAASAIDGVGAALVASEWQSRIPVGSQSKNSNNSGKRQSPPPIKGPGSIPSYFSSATKNVSAVKRGQSPPTKNDPAVARSTSSTAGAAEVGTHQGATASPAPGMYSYLEEFDQQASASAARAAAREALKAAEKAQKAPRKPPPTLPAYAATSHRDGSKIAHSSKPNDSRESSSSSSRNNQPTSAAKQQKEHRQLPHDRQLPGGGPPAYAYRDVVRKKCDREALPGHTCERCEGLSVCLRGCVCLCQYVYHFTAVPCQTMVSRRLTPPFAHLYL